MPVTTLLLILIPTIWLALVAFVVLLCRGAARGDAAMLSSSEMPPSSMRLVRSGALRLFEEPPAGYSRGSRLRGEGVVRVRGVRGRAGRCVAGS
jgi:hypothetical protein